MAKVNAAGWIFGIFSSLFLCAFLAHPALADPDDLAGESEDVKVLERIEGNIFKLERAKRFTGDIEKLKHDILEWMVSIHQIQNSPHTSSEEVYSRIYEKIEELEDKIYEISKKYLKWNDAELNYHEKEYSARLGISKRPEDLSATNDKLSDIELKRLRSFIEDSSRVWVSFSKEDRVISGDLAATSYSLQDKIPSGKKGNIIISKSLSKNEKPIEIAFIAQDDLEFYQGRTFKEAIELSQKRKIQSRSGEFSGTNDTGLWLRFSDEAEIKFYAWGTELPNLKGKTVEIFSKQVGAKKRSASKIGEIKEWSSFHLMAEIPSEEFKTLKSGWTPEKLIQLAAAESSFVIGNCKAILKNIPKN